MSKFVAFAAVFTTVSCVSLPAVADGKESLYFYDGARKIELILEAGLVAEFMTPESVSAVKKASPEAEQVPVGAGGPHVFKVPATNFRPRTTTGTTTSPVFRAGSRAGRLMALPGGMVVTFKPEWTDAQVREFVASKGLEVQQRMEITGNWYVLRTEPGLAALKAANALHESGKVVSASPNWWKETVTR